MAQYINTNIASLNAQRNLNTSQGDMQTALQRLSSGLRINSAKDDAAGLAIATRMTTQINGLDQAARNASDGISLSQTAESALGELTNNLQRIRQLAVESANASNSSSDRAALDQEVQQRIAEVDRVAAQTSFNGLKVLDGTFGNAVFQVGANVGETIGINLSTSLRAIALGKTANYVSSTAAFNQAVDLGQQGQGVSSAALTAGAATIAIGSGSAISIAASNPYAGTATGQDGTSAYAKVAAINASGVGGLTAVAETEAVFSWSNVTTTNTAYSFSINGTAIYTNLNTSATGTNAALTGTAFAAAVNANSSNTGVTAEFTNGQIALEALDGRNLVLSQTTTAETGTGLGALAGTNNVVNTAVGSAATATTAVAKTETYYGVIQLEAADVITLGGTPAPLGYSAGSLALGANSLSSANVTSVTNANNAIQQVDAALQTVNALRSSLGAMQNRFDSVVSSLQAVSENLSASRSRVQDTDFAAETAHLTRAQILQQAGIAMLAQANSMPNMVLSLLK